MIAISGPTLGFLIGASLLGLFLLNRSLLGLTDNSYGESLLLVAKDGFLVAIVSLYLYTRFQQIKTQTQNQEQECQRDLAQHHQLLFDHNPQPMWIFDEHTLGFLNVNQAAVQTYGYSPSEWLSMTLDDVCFTTGVEGGKTLAQHHTKDGTLLEVKVTISPFIFNGKPAQLAAIENVTQHQHTLKELKHKEEQYRILASNFPNGAVMLYDQDLRYTLAEGMGLCNLGQKGKIFEGQTLQETFAPEICTLLEPLYREALGGKTISTELIWGDRTYQTYIVPAYNEKGQVESGMSVIQDISERKEMERQLQHYAFYDTGTGLPNKTWFLKRLEEQLKATIEGESSFFTLMLLELNRYPSVKYSLGPQWAEALMNAAAERLQTCLNLTDPVSRVGDHTLGMVVNNLHTHLDAQAIADYIEQQFNQPLEVEGKQVFSPATLGIALVDSPELAQKKPEEWLQAVDTAVTYAKEKEHSTYAIFNPSMHEQALGRFQLETDLRLAIQQQEFVLYYQPIVSLVTGKIHGFEALVRWNHPSEGWISPGAFIPVAEETGLIGLIDWWVLGEACKQLSEWQKKLPGKTPLMMSVNASGSLLSQLGFMERLRQVTIANQVQRGTLKLEVTERVVMEQQSAVTPMLDRIKAQGIKLSVDDFGTGYSCLERLHQLPIDTLKIDRSFVSQMLSDDNSLEITRTIITLAHSLKMDAIAEGVETMEQMEMLRSLNCEYGQGYLFAHPVPSEDVPQLLLQGS